MAKSRLATALIVGASLAGAFALTEQITPGIQSLFQSGGSAGQTGQDQSFQSDAITYQYGTLQVEVIRSNGKITSINMLQAGADAGREKAFPTLIQAAIQAQGSGFGNLSGATTTTEAFKQALDSAIAKFN